MPKNPNKKRCQTQSCRSWAMRSHSHCRAHLDYQLGPRAAGAPKGNLNAVKTGRYAHPLSKKELQQLAYEIAQNPGTLPGHIMPALQFVHERSNNPVRSLNLLNRFLLQLIPYVADALFATELDAYIKSLPPDKQAETQALVWKKTLPLDHTERLLVLRALVEKFPPKKQLPEKQLMG